MSERYLNFRELGDLLKVGRSSIYRRVADGTLPNPVKLGKLVRFREADVHAAMRALELKKKINDERERIQTNERCEK